MCSHFVNFQSERFCHCSQFVFYLYVTQMRQFQTTLTSRLPANLPCHKYNLWLVSCLFLLSRKLISSIFLLKQHWALLVKTTFQSPEPQFWFVLICFAVLLQRSCKKEVFRPVPAISSYFPFKSQSDTIVFNWGKNNNKMTINSLLFIMCTLVVNVSIMKSDPFKKLG